MKAWWCVAIFVIGFFSCGRETTDAPLDRTDRGIAALRWGDGGETVAARMQEMEGVYLFRDTVVTWYFAYYDSPDTVIVPSHLRHLRHMEFRGGRWLGFPVAWWIVTVDRETSLRNIEIELVPIENVHPTMRRLRRQLNRLYGASGPLESESNRYYADGWVKPAMDPSTASSIISVGQWGKNVRFEVTDRHWSDSLIHHQNSSPRRRVHVSEWEKIKKQVRKETGWMVE